MASVSYYDHQANRDRLDEIRRETETMLADFRETMVSFRSQMRASADESRAARFRFADELRGWVDDFRERCADGAAQRTAALDEIRASITELLGRDAPPRKIRKKRTTKRKSKAAPASEMQVRFRRVDPSSDGA
ncbi:MAG: hypothetical protein AAGI17_00820 [Planctomycetota bacterium]